MAAKPRREGTTGTPLWSLGQCGAFLVTGCRTLHRTRNGRIRGIAACLLSAVWIVLTDPEHPAARFLSILTFAHGGAGRTPIGWLGGLLGKTFVAAACMTLLTGGQRSVLPGLQCLRSAASDIATALCGAGSALVLYQHFAGSAALSDAAPAVTGLLLSLMSMGRGFCFLHPLTSSLTARRRGGERLPDPEREHALLSGAAGGFLLAIPLSAVPLGWLPLSAGTLLLIAGLLLKRRFFRALLAALVLLPVTTLLWGMPPENPHVTGPVQALFLGAGGVIAAFSAAAGNDDGSRHEFSAVSKKI